MSAPVDVPSPVIIRLFDEVEYEESWQKMQDFTSNRDEKSVDEIWLLQHPPVFTLGKNGKPEHVLNPADIPVINSDRGGQVTYHGPGQLVIYTLLDLNRLNLGVRQLVTILEQTVIDLLALYGIESSARAEAPGVYVNNAKIAALGLRVRKGRSFHGLALNVDMDLEPFSRINPCGYEGLEVTQIVECVDADDNRVEFSTVAAQLQSLLLKNLGLEKFRA